MDRVFLATSGICGFLGVFAGAFGAHALKQKLSADLIAVYQTGVLYHLIHVLAIAGIALWLRQDQSRLIMASGWLFVAGIVLFSGSLYLLAITGVRGLGAVTPVGGLAFLAGWACLTVAALQK